MIVIEDHVVGYQLPDLETDIWFEDVLLMDDDLNPTTVFADSSMVTVLNDTIVSSTQSILDEAIAVFPNPVSYGLNFKVPHDQNWQLKMMDVNGRIYTQKELTLGQENHRLPIPNHWPNGTYFLHFYNENAYWTERILIQR